MKIKKQNLLLLASLVWMIAGFNVFVGSGLKLMLNIRLYKLYRDNYRVSSLLVHGIL